MANPGSSNRRPEYDYADTGGYVDGRYQSPVLTPLGEKQVRMFEKTTKFELYRIALFLAQRIAGNDYMGDALDVMEAEKATLKANQII